MGAFVSGYLFGLSVASVISAALFFGLSSFDDNSVIKEREQALQKKLDECIYAEAESNNNPLAD